MEALLAAAYDTPPDLAGSLSGLRSVLRHFQGGDLSLYPSNRLSAGRHRRLAGPGLPRPWHTPLCQLDFL